MLEVEVRKQWEVLMKAYETYKLALAFIDQSHPLHDLPIAAGKALEHWGLVEGTIELCESSDITAALQAANAQTSTCLALANRSECKAVRTVLKSVQFGAVRLLDAEAVMLRCSSDLTNQHDTVRALIAEGLHKLGGNAQKELDAVLAEAAGELSKLHPYFQLNR